MPKKKTPPVHSLPITPTGQNGGPHVIQVTRHSRETYNTGHGPKRRVCSSRATMSHLWVTWVVGYGTLVATYTDHVKHVPKTQQEHICHHSPGYLQERFPPCKHVAPSMCGNISQISLNKNVTSYLTCAERSFTEDPERSASPSASPRSG